MTIEKTFIGSTYIMGVSPLWYDDSTPVYVDPAVISQYANSPTLNRLISDFAGYIDPTDDFKNFLSFVWDVKTAQAWGLDILGRIVGITRRIKIPYTGKFFGFAEGSGQPFGQAPFYSQSASQNYSLTDDAYRTLILFKAALNISDCTAPTVNKMLTKLFYGRGRCYCADIGNMQMLLVFEFPLLPYELSILMQSGATPRPAAVECFVHQTSQSGLFGFGEGGGQPFGHGAFFDSVKNLTIAK